MDIGQALTEFTQKTPRFFDQQIRFSHEEGGNKYYIVGFQHESTHVKFYIHVGLPTDQEDWTQLVPVLAEEANKVEVRAE